MNINNHSLLGQRVPDLIRNVTLMGYHKSPKFIEFLVNKGYVFTGIQDENKVSNLLRAIALFEEKYGDNVDLQWIREGNRNYAPVFKVVYPKFNITNSQGQSHQIRDLFVLHRFSYSSFGTFTIKRPQGGRLSKTVEEIVSTYQQSHLTGHSEWIRQPFEATEFCLGNDTDVSRMLAEFEAELDWDRLELYLYCVDSMVTWESIEGVPFRYMSSIKNSTSSSVGSFDSNCADKIIRKILNTKTPLDVDFYVKDNRYKIATNKRASDFIKKIVLDTVTVSDYKRILVTVHPSDCQKYLAMGTQSLEAKKFMLKSLKKNKKKKNKSQ
jgi:hypothetical protein